MTAPPALLTHEEAAQVAPAVLTDAEIAAICHPYVQHAAKVRYLSSLGLTVKRRPDGSPLVSRSNFDAVMNGKRAEAANGPRWSK